MIRFTFDMLLRLLNLLDRVMHFYEPKRTETDQNSSVFSYFSSGTFINSAGGSADKICRVYGLFQKRPFVDQFQYKFVLPMVLKTTEK